MMKEGHGTLEAPIALSKERENNRKRLQSRGKNNDEQISPNEESAGSEQEDKRAFLQGEGRFKHQGISERKTGRRQRRRSRSFDRRRSSSQAGTGSHAIIDTIIKETRGNRKETLS